MAKAKQGRKGKYHSHVEPYFKEIDKWLNQGATERQVAQRLGIAYSSFNDYKNRFPDFLELLKRKRVGMIDDLKGALYKRAMGYEYKETTTSIRMMEGKEIRVVEEKTKHQPPDVGACHLLLKNLDEEWHNDDFKTLQMKLKELELKQKQVEANVWE